MKTEKLIFFFVAITVLSLSVYPWLHTTNFDFQLNITLSLVFIFGIPHGAIDHLVYFKNRPKTTAQLLLFYGAYLGLIGLYAVLWILCPYISLVFFFFISFYHFGQSQLSYVNLKERNLLKVCFYLCWGASILLGLVCYHYTKVMQLFTATIYFAQAPTYFSYDLLEVLLLLSSGMAVLLMAYVFLVIEKSWNELTSEIIYLSLIHAAFYLLPPLIGFAIYFAFWHSLRVLLEEYVFIKKTDKGVSLVKFVRLLAPHSIISIAGALILLLLVQHIDFSLSPFLIIMIFLSVLTLPHSIVMEKLYRR